MGLFIELSNYLVSSNELEILGFVDTLAKVENDLWTPTSITTDKNRRIIQQVNNRLIEHKLDPWHFIKNLRNTLRKVLYSLFTLLITSSARKTTCCLSTT